MEKYQKRVTVRLTTAQHKILEKKAKEHNKTISLYLRQMLTALLVGDTTDD